MYGQGTSLVSRHGEAAAQLLLPPNAFMSSACRSQQVPAQFYFNASLSLMLWVPVDIHPRHRYASSQVYAAKSDPAPVHL